jgi:hypothetical protein
VTTHDDDERAEYIYSTHVIFLSALALRGCVVREMMLQTDKPSLKTQQHGKRNQNAAEKQQHGQSNK